jgi:hypothetical protein
MAYERLQNSGLARALTDLLADLADLVRKELPTRRTISAKPVASWRVVAGGRCSFKPYRQGLCVECQTFRKAAFPVRDAKP